MKITQKQDGRWYDENDNSWITEELAIRYSITLDNCKYCNNCINCSCCYNCNNCNNCDYCINCNNCKYCNNCNYCINCNYSITLDNCNYCNYCNNCDNCDNCINCNNCINCDNCNNCINCDNCDNCNYCDNCNGFKTNPQRIVSPNIGSRKDQTYIYWTNKKDVFVICGCYRGPFQDFKLRVKLTHKDNPEYLEEYENFIKKVEQYIGL